MEAATPPAAADSLAQVRARLHQLVDGIDDPAVLEALQVLLRNALPAAPPLDAAVRLEDLAPAERSAVEEGLRQLDAGEGRPHAEVWAEVEAEFGIKSPQWK